MADRVSSLMVGLRAMLTASPAVAAFVGDRVVDEPEQDIAFPYVRFGDLDPVPDDTDGTRGAVIQAGLEVHSRPADRLGRVEAVRICEALEVALHKRPEVLAVAGSVVVEIRVQTWAVSRAADGVTYRGALAFEVQLEDA